jgi:hypothetical protein
MTQSVDPEFARRVAEYQQNLKKGIVFQADGTVGGKRVKRRRRSAWRGNALRHFMKLAIAAVLIKIVLFHAAHIVEFDANSAVVMASPDFVQKAIGVLFYPDPISMEASRWLTIGQTILAMEIRSLL